MIVKKFERLFKTNNGFLVQGKEALIKLVFMTDDIVRIRVSFDGQFDEHSYALVKTAWDDALDPIFKDERERITPVEVKYQEQEKVVEFETNTIKLVLNKEPLSFCLIDKKSNQVVYSDLKDRAYEQDHLGRLFHYSAIDPKYDHFFGFGEKTGHLDKKGRHMRTCPKDAIGHDPEFGEPLYKHIPFYIRVNEMLGSYVGLFYNNSHDCAFDMGNERSGYWDPYCYYQVDGGDIDLFLIYGPSLKKVVERYTYLTGTTAMPTMQSLGFTSSTMYYAELEKNCDQEIYQVINKHLSEDLYIDNFWLASGYSAGEKDKLRYTFNWNYQRFPDPKAFFATLNEQGINVIPNLKPGVLMGHPYKDYYLEADALIKCAPDTTTQAHYNLASALSKEGLSPDSPGVLMGHPYKDYYLEADALIKCAPDTTTQAHYNLASALSKEGLSPDSTNASASSCADSASSCACAASADSSASADHNYIGRWWGGPGYFVDFTGPKGRNAWRHLLEENILKMGTKTVWNDNNEYDGVEDRNALVDAEGRGGPKGRNAWRHLLEENILKMGTKTVWNDNNEYDGVEDRNALVDAEGRGGTMAEYKPIQSLMMAYTGKEAIANVYPNERPYIINRAGYSGIQRYAQVWGGDNLTDWRTLKFNVATILGMGLSGVANTGSDIGGFAGPAPEGELLLRWIQNGIFQPRFTMNSANSDNTVTQPWMYQEYLPQIKAAYALRYRYLIYLYSLMRQANLKGSPVLRPLFYEFEHDLKAINDKNLTFMYGPYLLVANVLEKGQKERPIYLPEGHTWYDLNDNFKPYAGGQTIYYAVDENSIPMFIKDEAIVISSPDIKRIMFDKVKTLELTICATRALAAKAYGLTDAHTLMQAQQTQSQSQSFSFDYYEDDGHTKDFEQGVYANTNIRVTPGEVMEINFNKTGSYEHSYQKLSLKVLSPYKGALHVTCDNQELKRFLVPEDFKQATSGWYYNLSSRVIEIKCDRPAKDNYSIIVSTKHFDLIGMENNG